MDLGMSELLVIGIVALIVIGPKDLPEMFRQLGRFTAKLRAMSREFSRAMEQAANESGVKDVANDLKAMTNPKAMGMNAVKDAVDKFEKWDPVKNAAKPTEALKPGGPLVPPPMPAPIAAPVVAAPTDAPAAAIGPNTAALYEKKAAKAAILQETTAKLKAVDAGAVPQPPAPPTPPKTAPKTAPKTTANTAAGAATPAPKAPRKKKAAEE